MSKFEIIYSEKYNGEDFEHFILGLKSFQVEAKDEHQACFEFGKEMAYSDMSFDILKVSNIEEN